VSHVSQTDLHSKVLKPTPLSNQPAGVRLEIQCTPKEKTGEEDRATNDPASGLDIPPVKRRFPSSLCVTACRYMLSPAILYVPEKKNRQGCAKAAGLHVKSGQEIPEGLEEELPKKIKNGESEKWRERAQGEKKKNGKQSSSNSIRMKKKNIKMFFSSSSRHEADGW
jgi:hypothetical protein